MKVKDLIKKLQKLPQDSNVWVYDNCGGYYGLGDVDYNRKDNSVELS